MQQLKFYKLLVIILSLTVSPVWSGTPKKKKKKDIYKIEVIVEVPSTSVKNQQKTGTCWSYATTSFIEAELLRMGKGEHDLSEMYFARLAYPTKANKYVRNHGMGNFSQGGQAHDVMNVIKTHGFIPEEIYSGNNYGGRVHNHTEPVYMLKGMLDGLVKSRGKDGISLQWTDAFDAVLDSYFGVVPETFEYNGKKMSAGSFAGRMLNFNPSDYVEITSVMNSPYYEPYSLEVPDNWSNDMYYNVPLDDLIMIFNHSLKQGYSVCWDGDVSEPEFKHKKGLAIVPVKEWADKSKEEKSSLYDNYEEERVVTTELRQEHFDRLLATDDHLMHIIGISKDETGRRYYITKNSWGEDSNDFGGKLNMSEAYIKMNTIAIMVHKDAVPKNIADQMGLKQSEIRY